MDISNDPELDGKYLGSITSDFAKVADNLKEASYQIRKRGFSDHPIFPIARQECPIGQLLIPKEPLGLAWNYYATYLDEFIQRKIVDPKNVDRFVEVYKNPDEFCCLFVIDGAHTSFTFVPYPAD